MVSVDDGRLNEMAADPPGKLLPLLDRASAMAPLIVLMAMLPGLVSLMAVPPEIQSRTDALRGAAEEILSPWGHWLADRPWIDWTVGDASVGTWTAVVPSYLATVVLIWMTWHAGRGLFSARTGFLATLMVCGHTPVLMLGRSAEPVALGTVVSATTIIGLIFHLQCSRGLLSIPLVLAAIGLVATVLVAAPLAIATLAMMMIAVACNPAGVVGLWGDPSGVGRTRVGGVWSGPLSLLVVVVLGAAGVMTWSAMSGRGLIDPQLWAASCRGIRGGMEFSLLALALVSWLGLMAGPLLLGLGDLVLDVIRGEGSSRRIACLVLAWTLLATVLVGRALPGYSRHLAESFAMVPLILVATRGLVSVCDRRIGVGPTVAATVVSCCCSSKTAVGWLFNGEVALLGRMALVAIAAVGLAMAVSVVSRGNERRCRRILTACLACFLAAQIISGLLDVPVATVRATVAA